MMSKTFNDKLGVINILIVDDDEDTRYLYKKILDNKEKYAVELAENGMVGVDKYILHKPDVVIMDYQMPILNGIKAMKMILKFDENAKIIFISGNNDIKKKAKLEGAYMFILKPVPIRVLKSSIKSLVYITEKIV